tara:strand:- start:1872 stop:2963 length:1092 start_codon:yes stop_codon:yes gene_type:complete
MKFVDLFCGIGGISTGLKQAGYKLAFSVDNWKAAKLNHKSDKFYDFDLFNEKSQEKIIHKIQSESIDLLIGGPPCQGFSTLGKRSIKDRRNTLVDIFLKIISKSKPNFVIIENVRGLKTMDHPNGLKFDVHIKKTLRSKANGYIVNTIILDGLSFGMAQNRKRIFYIAIKKTRLKIKSEQLSLLILKYINSKKQKSKTLKDIIFDLPKVESGDTCTNKNIFNHTPFNHGLDIVNRIKCVPPGGGLQDIPDKLLNNHLLKMKNGGYGSGGFVKNVYGRLEWNKPSGTIIAGVRKITCGRLFHPESNRLLTVRECARLQTLPDDMEIYGSITEQYTLVGNAVPPLFSKILGNLILHLISKGYINE